MWSSTRWAREAGQMFELSVCCGVCAWCESLLCVTRNCRVHPGGVPFPSQQSCPHRAGLRRHGQGASGTSFSEHSVEYTPRQSIMMLHGSTQRCTPCMLYMRKNGVSTTTSHQQFQHSHTTPGTTPGSHHTRARDRCSLMPRQTRCLACTSSAPTRAR